MKFQVRPATPADDAAIAAVLSAANPRQTVTADMLARSREKVRNSPLGLHLAQWVAESEEGRAKAGFPVVGFLGIGQWAGYFEPDRYMLQLMVSPTFQRRGIGTRLAQVAHEHLRGRRARELFAWAFEDEPHAVNFLQQRGFTESAREFTSVLDVKAFDWSAWAARLSLPPGYTHLTYPQFAEQYGPKPALRAYTELFNQGRLDEPHTVAPRLYTPQEVQEYLTHPTFLPEGIRLAVTEAGELAALSELWLDSGEPHVLRTGLTATHPDHRRKGLALALKLAAIQAAQRRGADEIHTSNDSQNIGMLAINRALGFRPFPAHIEFRWGGHSMPPSPQENP